MMWHTFCKYKQKEWLLEMRTQRGRDKGGFPNVRHWATWWILVTFIHIHKIKEFWVIFKNSVWNMLRSRHLQGIQVGVLNKWLDDYIMPEKESKLDMWIQELSTDGSDKAIG